MLCDTCMYRRTEDRIRSSCLSCKHACPAYDLPMNRTSLRIEFCNCGKRQEGAEQ